VAGIGRLLLERSKTVKVLEHLIEALYRVQDLRSLNSTQVQALQRRVNQPEAGKPSRKIVGKHKKISIENL